MTKNRFRSKPTLDCYDATGILSFAGREMTVIDK